MIEDHVVLCGANAYEQKYYFNPDFSKLPQSIQDELHIICVLFTEDAGGVFTISFADDGEVLLETEAAEEDILYDEINSRMLIGELQKKRRELWQSLQLFYKMFILHEQIDVDALTETEEEE